MLGRLTRHVQKNETRLLCYTRTKINSKWIWELNLRPKIVKVHEENIGDELLDISIGNAFFSPNSKSKSKKAKNKQMGLHQIKKLLHTEQTINKMKRQSTKWENIFSNHVSDILISKICKELIQLNSKKSKNPKNPIKNGLRIWADIFQRGQTDGQQTHWKMFNISNHQRNANQNHNEISSQYLLDR